MLRRSATAFRNSSANEGRRCDQTVYVKMGEDVYLHLREPKGRSFHDVRWSPECSDPPVVELVVCTLEVTVLHCAGENGPDAVYEWNVSVLNQGLWTVFSYTGKYVLLNYSTGNISCSLKKGNYFSRSDAYFLSCSGPGPLAPDMNWCLSLEFTVLLVLLCFMTCGISVGVQICRKLQNTSVKSEQGNTSLVRTRDDGIVYSEVRVGIQQK
ncbi:hypothetical protein GJAV_G00196370 [Gymnothorax javanicus]|nr:hypothetical protein GJAV_G00196370 [Gymnothorax javanicus]